MPKQKVIKIPFPPMGKPRMTRADKWKCRSEVVRYRQWADAMRAFTNGKIPNNPDSVSWNAYMPIPESWSQRKKTAMAGKPHRQKPDRDNIDKAICDALWKRDEGIWTGFQAKFWDDGNKPRLVLTMEEL